MGINDFASSLLKDSHQNKSLDSKGNLDGRKVYPAIVVSSEDPLEQGRIVARLVSVDEKGNIKGGKDKDTPDDRLPFCMPMKSSFFHALPNDGEMVFLILENPSDISAPRYWTGPIISSQLRLKFQSYQESIKIYDKTRFNINQKIESRLDASNLLPTKSDIALIGRDDAYLILRPKKVDIIAGLFKEGTYLNNTETPCYIRLEQKTNDKTKNLKFDKYSNIEIHGSVINLYSPIGKFRDKSLEQFEISDHLDSFSEISRKLHPSVFGDELVSFLDLFIKAFLNHIHTPQLPPADNAIINQLKKYTKEGELQRLLSNHIRIN